MASKDKNNILIWLFLFVAGAFLLTNITSCGKNGNASPTGLNIQYQILNLSPDLSPINLFIDFKQVNALTNPFVFNVNHGYFYVPSIDTPYQIRSALTSGTPISALTRDDILKSGAKYSLFITGTVADNSLYEIFMVDTSKLPTVGRGKLRFVNASPSATGGLDVYANGTLAFPGIVYKKYSDYLELPNGNYDLQLTATGSNTVIKDLPAVTIQDGRLYTFYAYGYTTRTDTAAFNAAVLTNR